MYRCNSPALFSAIVMGLALGACQPDAGDGSGDAGADASMVIEGQALYEEPLDDGNTFACASCHALHEPAPDGLRRPGHPIGNATRRPSYKNGQLTEMRRAVNTCLDEWMGAETWDEGDPRWTALRDYLDEQANVESAPALQSDIVDPPANLAGGDSQMGAEIFAGSCAVCHGADGGGTQRAIRVSNRGLEPEYVAERVRHSGTEESAVYAGLTGGRMPFWAGDRLSDEELRHIVAFLAREPTAEDAGMDAGADASDTGDGDTADMDTGGEDAGAEDASSGCEATHERVGWTAEFDTKFHDVGGTAEIVDDCTVRITNFTYDGTGIDVRFYGAQGTDFDNGFSMSEDLVRGQAYNGETVTATIPDGKIDSLDSISVWCVDVGVDFGSGTFSAP